MTSNDKFHSCSSTRKSSFSFHPFELAFCGYSGYGKTTLITRLLQHFSSNYHIGYLKHDAHQFQMDHKGKDTSLAWEAGASEVFISDPHHCAHLQKGNPYPKQLQHRFLFSDWLFVEGYKDSSLPKILVLDKASEILNHITENVIALVGPHTQRPSSHKDFPYFSRDQVSEIAHFIEQFFLNKVQQTPLYGLVLTGGHSRRMGKDKALLHYHGRPQWEVAFHLLEKLCQKVFVSTRPQQRNLPPQYPIIEDQFLNIGPLGGILSALRFEPSAAWFVLAVDLPFLKEEVLKDLVHHRNPYRVATCYESASQKSGVEPLCAIYEPKSFLHLMNFFAFGSTCPRKALMNAPHSLHSLSDKSVLANMNFPEEFQKAQQSLQGGPQ